jgi:hypothetical protein
LGVEKALMVTLRELRDLGQEGWPVGSPDGEHMSLRQAWVDAGYTHRVAISNARLLNVSDSGVTFTYKDYVAGGARKTMTLSGVEFLRRFFTHLLPKGFVHIRSYGLLANRHRQNKLALCREILSQQQRAKDPDLFASRSEIAEAKHVEPPEEAPRCRCCGGRLRGLDYRPRPSREMLRSLKWPWDTS